MVRVMTIEDYDPVSYTHLVSASQIRTIIVLGANRQPQAEYPNEEWGYGTMDLYLSLIHI